MIYMIRCIDPFYSLAEVRVFLKPIRCTCIFDVQVFSTYVRFDVATFDVDAFDV